MKARVSHLHKTEAEWEKLSSWKPEAGELVVYDIDDKHDYSRLKIGDGKTSVVDLPFIDKIIAEELLKKADINYVDGKTNLDAFDLKFFKSLY